MKDALGIENKGLRSRLESLEKKFQETCNCLGKTEEENELLATENDVLIQKLGHLESRLKTFEIFKTAVVKLDTASIDTDEVATQ